MRVYESTRSEKLKRILRKLHKKDRKRLEKTLRKIREISTSANPHHYKNLSHDLKDFKRVHIDSHFVLLFRIDEEKKTIRFNDLQHHDVVYGRK